MNLIYYHLFIIFFFNILPENYHSSEPSKKLIITADYTWHLRKNEGGIKVYSRKNPANDITQMKAVTILNTTLNGAVALIKDTEAGPEWVDRMKLFKVIKAINDKEWYTYSELEIPWPFDNRDIVTHNTIVQDSLTKSVTIFVKGEPRFIPEKKGKVRMQASDGSWVFIPVEKSKVEVTYIFWSESGTLSLPSQITMPIVVKSFYNTFKNMRKIIEKEKYKKAIYNYIK